MLCLCMQLCLKTGGRGTQQMFIWGCSAPRSHPLPLYMPFFRKRYPFRIPSINKQYPFHIPCLELCFPFNCCKCTVFQTGIDHKTRTFSRLYKAIKSSVSPLGPFTHPNDRLPSLSYTSTSKIPIPFHIYLKLENRRPVSSVGRAPVC